MATLVWPDGVNSTPDLNTISPVKRMLDPIKTDMEGGNTRLRTRPGDNVGTITQTIRMKSSELAVFVEWVKNTLNNGTARFTTRVRIGTTFEFKVCQFSGGAPTYRPVGTKATDVTMTLLVYDV